MNFTGTLNTNEIFGALYNMIISQEVLGDNIASTTSSLVDKARVDGTLYGDQKIYFSTDCLASTEWGNDAEAQNLLVLHRPQAPDVQAITLDVFRQISLTLDSYLTKQAFSDEGTFSAFNSMMMGWMNDTKRIYDATTYNTYIGTTETEEGKQKMTINVGAEPENGEAEVEAYNRLRAQAVATAMADLLVAIKDPNRDYNDYGHMRSWDAEDLIVVWNSEVYNELRKLDMPSIFHNDGLIDKFGEEVLPGKYFGTVNTEGGTTPATNLTVRALKEGIYGTKHLFAGELLDGSVAYEANTTYTEDNTIAFKVVHKRSVPYMSAFEVGTSFFNAKSLTTNHYLTFGRNTLEYLQDFPMITARITSA